MNHRCPYCRQATAAPSVPLLSHQRGIIYRTIVAAGPHGVSVADLLAKVYGAPDRAPPSAHTVLRVNIHETNKVIRPIGQRIRGKNKTYHLVAA